MTRSRTIRCITDERCDSVTRFLLRRLPERSIIAAERSGNPQTGLKLESIIRRHSWHFPEYLLGNFGFRAFVNDAFIRTKYIGVRRLDPICTTGVIKSVLRCFFGDRLSGCIRWSWECARALTDLMRSAESRIKRIVRN